MMHRMGSRPRGNDSLVILNERTEDCFRLIPTLNTDDPLIHSSGNFAAATTLRNFTISLRM